jgi:cellobiose transport system permease protein
MSTTSGAPAGLRRSRVEPEQATGGARPPQSAWRNRLHKFDMKRTPYLLIAPYFILFAVFGLFPLIFNGIVAFRNWRLDEPDLTGWAGWTNFIKIFKDSDFWNALYNTFGIFLLSSVPQLLLALVFASVLNRKLRGQTWWRVSALLPYITPVVASTLVFNVFFDRDSGIARWVMDTVGYHPNPPLDWHSTKLVSWIALATMVNWKWTGYNALLYLSAMQTIPRDVYEAAAIDGASPWKQLWRITVPMIRPVVIFTVVISTINGLQIFTEPMLFDQNPTTASGGPDHQWQTIAQLIYKTGWRDLNLGKAAAMSWVLFLIIVLITSLNALITNRLGSGRKM